MSLTGDGLFISPLSAELDDFDDFGGPEADYLDGDNSFDFENADLGGDMTGALPGTAAEQHEKRKSPDENADAEAGDAKRQETSTKKSKKRGSGQGEDGDTVAKKPGRKPLTNEPTTKRKAQNRAAQRAFRERKEKHLKDLETKVSELTKSSEADKHENGLLRAQVDRLQTELREYRKRLSLNGVSGQNRSPTLGGQHRSNSGSSGQFSFDFPKFGALPGNLIFGNQAGANGVVKRESRTPPTAPSSRHNSQGRSLSPADVTSLPSAITSRSINNANPNVGFSTIDNMHGFAGTLPQMGSNDPFSDLFSPSVLKGASFDGNNYFGDMNQAHARQDVVNGVDNAAAFPNMPQFTSGSSISDSASPSNSSTSQWHANGASSSCGTSPEPSTDSPNIKDFSMNQGSQLRNSISQVDAVPQDSIFNPTDFSVPSASTFDPTLFGDYRDTSMDNLFGTDLTGGLYDETLAAPFDMGSPSTLFGILQSPATNTIPLASTNANASQPKPCEKLMQEMEKVRDGGDDDYGLPSAQPATNADSTKLISCNNIWNQLQSNADFQEGKFDLDGLCSELRTKARCSESGVMVDQDHVEAALRKLGKKNLSPREANGSPNLMFEQQSWDNVLKKMNGGQA